MTEHPYHHGNLHAALLCAARQAIEARGPASLSLRGLARTVGVAAPSVYNHFSGLDALRLALAEQGFAELAVILKEAGPKPLSLGLVYLDFARANPGLYRLMFGEGYLRDSPEGTRLRELRQAAFAPLIALTGSREAGLHHWALVHGLASLVINGQVPLGADPEALFRTILTQR